MLISFHLRASMSNWIVHNAMWRKSSPARPPNAFNATRNPQFMLDFLVSSANPAILPRHGRQQSFTFIISRLTMATGAKQIARYAIQGLTQNIPASVATTTSPIPSPSATRTRVSLKKYFLTAPHVIPTAGGKISHDSLCDWTPSACNHLGKRHDGRGNCV